MSPTDSISLSERIDAPIWRVYQNWRRFERFPSFVPAVHEARWLSKNHLRWREEYEGHEFESTYEITLRLAESSLSWRSLSGPESAGTAHCEPQPDGKTLVTLTISYVPDDGAQSPTAIEKRHRDFLTLFKQFVEARGKPGPRGDDRLLQAEA